MMLPIEIVFVGSVATLVSYIAQSDIVLFIEGLTGALIMAAIPLMIVVIGKVLFKKDVMGTGDIYLASPIILILNFYL